MRQRKNTITPPKVEMITITMELIKTMEVTEELDPNSTKDLMA